MLDLHRAGDEKVNWITDKDLPRAILLALLEAGE